MEAGAGYDEGLRELVRKPRRNIVDFAGAFRLLVIEFNIRLWSSSIHFQIRLLIFYQLPSFSSKSQ